MARFSSHVVSLLAASLVLTLAGCGPTAVDSEAAPLDARALATLDRQLGDKVAGEPRSCIALSVANRPIAVSDTIVLYRVSGRLVYRNDLRSSCRGLADGSDIVVTRPFGSQLCDGDTLQLVDNATGAPTGGCTLGPFVPYRKPG
ncbi:MAG: hypothetical protein GW859_06695 [Sphingomonadales bacterium]|nr:hypothetical protein [Sphingomonadales bacterium]